tara:strand:- start:67 stop:1008 length:942 start_codon:yes stop_codon:yes gene_type:complete
MANPVFETYGTKGIREDLADIIYNIAPTDTPFMSNVGKGTASGTYHEWQTDDLTAASDNKVAEGAAAPAAESVASVRVGNYTQIASKTVSVSGSNEAADAAGRASQMAYQLAKKGMELKRDMEKTLVGTDKAQVAGAASGTARELASVTSWLGTNCSFGSGGDAPDGDGTDIGGAGTDRDFTEALLTGVIEDCWVQGGTPSIIMCNAFQKAKLTAFTGNATKFKNVDDKTIVNAVDVYVSDYGELSVVPNRLMLNETVLVLQPDMFSVDTYRDFQTSDIAKTGDFESKQLLVEYTLASKNEAASGSIRDLNVS